MITLAAPTSPSPGYRLADGALVRQYQIRAAFKMFLGTPLRDKITGRYVHENPTRDGTAVHIDMGLGKTIIGLTAIVDWFRFGVITRPVLLLAPIKVCEAVWRQEALQWSHTRHLRFTLLRGDERQRAYALARAVSATGERFTDVILVNPELLKWLKKWLRNDWSFFDALIIDDVGFKDNRSQQFRSISNYGERSGMLNPETGKVFRDAYGHVIKIPAYRFKRSAKLTGTPSTSGLHNLWSPMYLLDHGSRLHTDYGTFEGRFFHKTKQVADHVFDIDINKEEAESRPAWVAREQAPERIHELIADITVELNAEDYGVLPKVMGDASKGEVPDSHLHRIELPDDLRRRYDVLEREAVLELTKDFVMASNGGAKSMMCWQIANGAVYRTDDFGRKEAEEVHTLKLDKMVELIDRINSNVVIPYYFKHDFARITARLKAEGMAFAAFGKSNAERIIDQFSAGQIPILLLHPQSAGHGIDRLQHGGHNFIWFTLLWSLERYKQTMARLARGGQKEVVHNHHIVASRTTDELMLINLRQNGTDQEKFRAALREYQKIRGIDLMGVGL